MPGKVNPVIAESLTQVCAMVIGNDTTIVIAGQSGNFELNVMLPVAVRSSAALDSLSRHERAQLRRQPGRRADRHERAAPTLVESGLMLVTALAPEIGYDAAAALAKEAYQRPHHPRPCPRKDLAVGAGARPHPRSRGHGRARQNLRRAGG